MSYIHNFIHVGWLYVFVGWLHIGYPPNELATTRRQEGMMRPQLGNKLTDTRQTDMSQRDPL